MLVVTGAVVACVIAVSGWILTWADTNSRGRGRMYWQRWPGQLVTIANSRLWASSAGSGIVGAIVAWMMVGVPVLWVLAAGAAAAVPWAVERRKVAKAASERAQAWPETIDLLASCLTAGSTVADACRMAANEGPARVRPIFSEIAAAMDAGRTFSGAVESVRSSASRHWRGTEHQVFTVLVIAAEHGGHDVGTILQQFAESVRTDIRLRGELAARQAWTINGARVTVVAPWLVVLALSAMPDAAVAYRQPAGSLLLVVCAAVSVVAYGLMRRIAQIPLPEGTRRPSHPLGAPAEPVHESW